MPSVKPPEGGGAAVTVTVALCDAGVVPVAPEQVSVYVAVAVGVTACVPLVAFVPVQLPDAVHDVAFVEDHVRVEDWPVWIDVGLAESVTLGAPGGGGGGVVEPLVSDASSMMSIPVLSMSWYTVARVFPVGTVNEPEYCFHVPPDDGRSASHA